MIAFKRQELEWHCRTSRVCECQEDFSSENRPWDNDNIVGLSLYERDVHHAYSVIAEATLTAVHDTWRDNIVQTYSALKLTKASDLLPALSGIAALVKQRFPDENYLAGLWSSNLIQGLQWFRKEGEILEPATAHRAPSWSWASVDGPTEYRGPEFGDIEGLAQAVHVTVVNVEGGPFASEKNGGIRSQNLVLKAPLLRVEASIYLLPPSGGHENELTYRYTIQNDDRPAVDVCGPIVDGEKDQFILDTTLTVESYDGGDGQCFHRAYSPHKRQEQHGSVWLLFLVVETQWNEPRIYRCLVLGRGALGSSYERLGYWSFSTLHPAGSERWIDAAEIETVTIM